MDGKDGEMINTLTNCHQLNNFSNHFGRESQDGGRIGGDCTHLLPPNCSYN